MKINLKIDDNLEEDVAEFRVRKLTEQVQKAINYLSTDEPKVIIGYKDDEIVLLKSDEIVLISTQGKKVFARVESGDDYLVKERLYVLEESLQNAGFIRIANSSLANGEMIRKLKMEHDGSLKVIFKDGSMEFASRRSVKNIKDYLKIGVKK